MRYDGCVGALVIVLGVGAALVTTPPVALAQPSDTESASSSTTSGGSSGGADSPDSTSAGGSKTDQIAFSLDNRLMFIAGTLGDIHVLDTATMQLGRSFSVGRFELHHA